MRILTIDDDIDQLKSLSMNLRSSGYDIDSVDSAKGAISILEKAYSDIDLVITDYSMPGMSGMALLKVIKTKFPGTPVIMITAMGGYELEYASVLNGCEGFLCKPFTMEELIGEIERVVHKKYQSVNPDNDNRRGYI